MPDTLVSSNIVISSRTSSLGGNITRESIVSETNRLPEAGVYIYKSCISYILHYNIIYTDGSESMTLFISDNKSIKANEVSGSILSLFSA